MKKYEGAHWLSYTQDPPDESALRLIVNGIELVTVQSTPEDPEALGAGFLYTNSIIDRAEEISSMRFSPADSALYVTLTKSEFPMPRRFIITSGFGGGPVFTAEPAGGRLESGFRLFPDRLIALMAQMKLRALRYQASGGIHASSICSQLGIEFMAEDVGRQNSMDKVIGRSLLSGASFDDRALLTTGRISFEMVMKTLRAGISVLASLSSPTSKAVQLAEDAGLAIAGYVTPNGFIVYSGEFRFE